MMQLQLRYVLECVFLKRRHIVISPPEELLLQHYEPHSSSHRTMKTPEQLQQK